MSHLSHAAHLSITVFVPPPDLHPLYPTPALLSSLLSDSTLTHSERQTLVNHSLSRACQFGDFGLLTFLLGDERCNRWLDLEGRDEDGNTPLSIAILGFRGAREISDSIAVVVSPSGEEREEAEEEEIEREVEREECIRLLVKEGADLNTIDNSGWTPLHHAALLAPASLISYLLSRGASPLALSRRKLTPLDVITSSSVIPGRENAAALLRQATHSVLTPEVRDRLIKEGWRGDDKREEKRREEEKREERLMRKRKVKEDITGALSEELGKAESWGWGEGWEGEDELFEGSDIGEEDEDDFDDDTLPTPPDNSYSTMLVFSPPGLGRIFQTLIPLTPPPHRKLRDPLPAQALYLHCRFAAAACDHNWLEDLIVGAMDRVEEVVMANPNDLISLAHWLFNTTLLLHLLRCDESTNQICEILGLFGLLEEMVNVIYVLVIRIIERRLDPLIDTSLLDYVPPSLQEEWESVAFEGEWDGITGFFRSVVSPKKKPTTGSRITSTSTGKVANGSSGTSSKPTGNGMAARDRKVSMPARMAPSNSAGKMPPPPLPGGISASTSNNSVNSTVTAKSHGKTNSLNGPVSSRPSSPPPAQPSAFNTIRDAITSSSLFAVAAGESTGPSPSGSTANLTNAGKGGKGKEAEGPQKVTYLLGALHTFLSLAGVNPILIVQCFSQVMYWTACEMFNRILQRRKYLCRSRALHIGLNLGVLEEWISGSVGVGMPREVGGHFKVVRELVSWLQCLSSIDQFASLVATVQTFRHLNPLQMRRAVREYRYEVGESKMTEECLQYLQQLQKDWERQRVKMGVEAMKKEMGEREGSASSRGATNDREVMSPQSNSLSNSNSNSADFVAQQAIDNLFDRTFDKAEWLPAKCPAVLGELLDSRYMLPLLLPSDPMHLGALPVLPRERSVKRESRGLMPPSAGLAMTHSGASTERSHSRPSSIIGSRSASRASMTGRGAMEWIARTRKLRVVEKDMLKHLGDDEVASELESITAKWKWAWEGAIAAGTDAISPISPTVEKKQEADIRGEIGGIPIADEETAGPDSKLTMERPRIVKERRRASQMFEDY